MVCSQRLTGAVHCVLTQGPRRSDVLESREITGEINGDSEGVVVISSKGDIEPGKSVLVDFLGLDGRARHPTEKSQVPKQPKL